MMADQWELDTLAAINEKRRSRGTPSLKWSRRLEEEARRYVAHMSAWECIGGWSLGGANLEKVPRWVQEAKVEIAPPDWGPDKGIWESRSPADFPTGTVFTAITRGRRFEYKHVFERDGGMYYRRPMQPGYVSTSFWDTPKEISRHVVCSCHCPHWTPPGEIADLLWNDERLVGCHAKSAAVAIQNDDRFTYVAFACK